MDDRISPFIQFGESLLPNSGTWLSTYEFWPKLDAESPEI